MGSFLAPIKIAIAGIINITFRIGYTTITENKMIPLEDDNTDKLTVIYIMYVINSMLQPMVMKNNVSILVLPIKFPKRRIK